MSASPRHRPPAWIRNLLGLFLDAKVLEASLGDLEEKFQFRLQNDTPRWKATLLYTVEALGFLKMARRRRDESMQTNINMIRHTFLFFLRLVWKDLSYYAVSLLGLTISLSSFLFITMFIHDELSFDQFHEKKDRIFRVVTHLQLNDIGYDEATSQFPAAPALKAEMGEVEHAVRIFPQDMMLESGDKKFEEHIVFADQDFFDVFTFPLLYGDERIALKEPASVVLTEATAIKYFGSGNPVGKTILLNGQTLQVTGVMKNVPEQSHLKFDGVMPLQFQLNQWKRETGLEGRENKWFWTGAYTYVLVRSPADAARLEAKLPVFINKYFPDRYKEKGAFRLQRLADIHLRSSLDAELEPGGNILYVRLFSVVAVVIMLVSAINLINLSWFKISSRIREVGIRKFLGQRASRIIAQLSLESMLMGILAFLFAVILCRLFLTSFNLLVQKNLALWSVPNIVIVGVTFAMILAICLVAVARPAFRYATQSSVYLLLQKYRSPGSTRVRNTLIGLQVCFSFVLLVFSFIISSQIDFFSHKDLGFNKENVVIVELNDDFYDHLEAFKTDLRKSPYVRDVSGGGVPGGGYNGWRFVPEGGSYEKPMLLPMSWVDHNFLGTMNIKLLMGVNFPPNNNTDSLWRFLINKRAAVELGWTDDPLNKTMEIFAPGTTEIMARGRVIGVIDDYHFESLHVPVKPVVLTESPGFGTALVRVAGDQPEEAIAFLESTWKKFSAKPFVYEWLDKRLDKFYTNETQLSHVIVFFTFIALYLTCYGMFAMSSLLFSSKLKEVAIRKVFGANQFSIIRQFYSRYALFNLVAILVGVPVAVYVGNLWLHTFQYRIDLNASFFLKAGGCILLAGLLSVSYYLARVAFSNPVKFLRNE